MSTFKVQSLVFEKEHIDLQEAIDWIVSHGDITKKIDERTTQYRFQQLSPIYLDRIGYKIYRTKKVNDTVSLVLVYLE
jgi:hypothetical protein